MPYALPPAPPAIVSIDPRQAASSTASRPVFVAQHRRAAWPPSTSLRNAVRVKVGSALRARVTGATPGARWGRWFITTNGAAPWRTVVVDFDRGGRGVIYPSPTYRQPVCCEADPSRAVKSPRKRSW